MLLIIFFSFLPLLGQSDWLFKKKSCQTKYPLKRKCAQIHLFAHAELKKSSGIYTQLMSNSLCLFYIWNNTKTHQNVYKLVLTDSKGQSFIDFSLHYNISKTYQHIRSLNKFRRNRNKLTYILVLRNLVTWILCW